MTESDDSSNSQVALFILLGVILVGAILWPLSAIWLAGGADPEHAEFLAEEAERECVLAGFPPRQCPKMVGEHHLKCVDTTEKRDDEGQLDRDAYIKCMLSAFGDPPAESDSAVPADDDGGEQ